MLAIEMPRKDTKLRLDERILIALREKAEESGMSFNGLCETILFSYAKSTGKLPPDAEPLPEARGGKRQGSGKKPKTLTASESDVQKDDRASAPNNDSPVDGHE